VAPTPAPTETPAPSVVATTPTPPPAEIDAATIPLPAKAAAPVVEPAVESAKEKEQTAAVVEKAAETKAVDEKVKEADKSTEAPKAAAPSPEAAEKPAESSEKAAADESGAAVAETSAEKEKQAEASAEKPVEAPVAAKVATADELDIAVASEPAPPVAPTTSAKPAAATKRPTKRLTGDELLGDLFDAMGDLYFLASTLEGANFVVSLAMEKIPCSVGVCHFFDIDRREFLVSRAIGNTEELLLSRTPAREGLAAEVMNKRRAIVIADASQHGKPLPHWTRLGTEVKSAVVAPVALGGRWMGMLELVNPADGKPFLEGDGYALSYMAEQFAEFLGQRGLVNDPDVIRAFRPAR
jgi:putative methionine-R-sulfoxide reductase with GAF domain